MPYSEPARPGARRTRIRRTRVSGLLLVIGAVAAALGYQSVASSSIVSPGALLRGEGERRAAGETESVVPDGTTVLDGGVPAVANLDADLLAALRRAATAASVDGVELVVESGWRTPEHQERLLDDAVSEYGSEAQAARWVATPETSAHVTGDAVDIGPAAAAWLSRRGAGYGLCQVYANEPWHYELRPEAVGRGCPPPYPDPTHDPRMQP